MTPPPGPAGRSAHTASLILQRPSRCHFSGTRCGHGGGVKRGLVPGCGMRRSPSTSEGVWTWGGQAPGQRSLAARVPPSHQLVGVALRGPC